MRFRIRSAWPVAALLVVAMLARGAPAFADAAPPPPPPPTPQQEAFRATVQQTLDALKNVVASAQANPNTAPGIKVAQSDPNSMIAAAQQNLSALTSTELDALQASLGTNPSWQQSPGTLQSSVAAFAAKPSSSAPTAGAPKATDNLTFPYSPNIAGTFTSDCNSAGSAPDEFTATLAANEVQSAAQAAMLAAPGVIALFFVDVPSGVKQVLAAIWGVANAVFLGLSQALQASSDCAATAFGNLQSGTFPVDSTSTVIQGSSEISVVKLTQLATGTQQEIANVQNTVNAVSTQADTITTAATGLNTTLGDINTRTSEVQSDLQTLQTNVAILENTEVTVLNKANQEISNLSALQKLQIRMEIEANLARPAVPAGMIGLFQLPAAFGGQLETVRDIVTDVVNKEQATGHGNAQGPADLQSGNAAFAAGQYKQAYQFYSKAYSDVTK